LLTFLRWCVNLGIILPAAAKISLNRRKLKMVNSIRAGCQAGFD
jgi:hypothetical protein